MKKLASAFVALTLFIVVTSAYANTYTGSAQSSVHKEAGVTLKASATFVVTNLQLVVTLSNTGTFDPRSTSDILTGVFFDFAGDPHLTPVSATVAPSNSVIGLRHGLPLAFLGGDVNGEWAYKNDLAYPTAGDPTDNEGISSTKLKYFKKLDLFVPSGKIPGTSPLSGIQFGITTLDDLASINKGSLKNKGLIESTVVFVFDLPSNFSGLTADQISAEISDVNFQYGTSIKGGNDIAGEMVTQIPEPNTIALVAAGLLGAFALTGSRASRR
ncbi:MAG: XDD4 family exosortase-dependent surface protein [Verrucomicrobiia bacterium]|jgi:hypothetical protein